MDDGIPMNRVKAAEYATKVFTSHPENYDADAAAMSAWLTKRSADGWLIAAMTHEVLASGVIVSLVLAMKEAQPTIGGSPAAP